MSIQAHEAAALPRNRSTRYEDHQGLVRTLAKKYYARVQGAKLHSVEFCDVVGELGIAFTQAAAGYDITKGYSFTAFFGMCAQNHINKWLGKLCLEHYGEILPDDERVSGEAMGGRGLGYVSLDALPAEAMPELCDEALPAGDRLDALRELTYITMDQDLLPETRAYVATLFAPQRRTEQLMQRIEARSIEVKRQIKQHWGVDFGRNEL